MLRPTFVPSVTSVLMIVLVAALALLAGCDDDTRQADDTLGTPDTVVDTESPDPEDTVDPDTAPEPDTAEPEDASEPDLTDTTPEPDTTPDADADVDELPDQDTVDTHEPPKGCGFGSILGRSCSPSGEWLSGVRVSVEATDCDDALTVAEDITDEDGFFELNGVPAGTHTVIIETGSYTTEVEGIEVANGEVTDLRGELTKFCLESQSARIAVLTGVFDHVEALLDNQGIVYDLYEGDSADINPDVTRSGLDLLLDLSALLEYDIIIINSGEWYRLFEDGIDTPELLTMRSNLETFVLNGGSMFVTDWAYYWMETVFPEAVQFYGDPPPNESGQHAPGEEGAAKVGKLDPNVAATIETDRFSTALDATEMTINFNWAAWIVATGASFQSEVHMLAPIAPINPDPFVQQNAPLIVSYTPTETSGTVYFSAFHAAVQPTGQMEAALNFILFQL